MKMAKSVVSVLFLMTIYLSVRKSSSDVLPLDMAENSVDDSYEGCRDAMNELVTSKYIEDEKNNTPGFEAAWGNALQQCKQHKHGLSINQSAAVYLYTEEYNKNCSYIQFNIATRTRAEAYKSGAFQFYTLHFYLTDAVQQLTRNQTECLTSYRRTNVTFTTKVLNKKIRFGSFTSSSLGKNLTEFGEESCFEIYTCFGAKVGSYSKFPNEDEVLIPPYETFTVTGIKTRDMEKNLWCKVVYELKNAGKASYLQCAQIKSRTLAIVLSVGGAGTVFIVGVIWYRKKHR